MVHAPLTALDKGHVAQLFSIAKGEQVPETEINDTPNGLRKSNNPNNLAKINEPENRALLDKTHFNATLEDRMRAYQLLRQTDLLATAGLPVGTRTKPLEIRSPNPIQSLTDRLLTPVFPARSAFNMMVFPTALGGVERGEALAYIRTSADDNENVPNKVYVNSWQARDLGMAFYVPTAKIPLIDMPNSYFYLAYGANGSEITSTGGDLLGTDSFKNYVIQWLYPLPKLRILPFGILYKYSTEETSRTYPSMIDPEYNLHGYNVALPFAMGQSLLGQTMVIVDYEDMRSGKEMIVNGKPVRVGMNTMSLRELGEDGQYHDVESWVPASRKSYGLGIATLGGMLGRLPFTVKTETKSRVGLRGFPASAGGSSITDDEGGDTNTTILPNPFRGEGLTFANSSFRAEATLESGLGIDWWIFSLRGTSLVFEKSLSYLQNRRRQQSTMVGINNLWGIFSYNFTWMRDPIPVVDTPIWERDDAGNIIKDANGNPANDLASHDPVRATEQVFTLRGDAPQLVSRALFGQDTTLNITAFIQARVRGGDIDKTVSRWGITIGAGESSEERADRTSQTEIAGRAAPILSRGFAGGSEKMIVRNLLSDNTDLSAPTATVTAYSTRLTKRIEADRAKLTREIDDLDADSRKVLPPDTELTRLNVADFRIDNINTRSELMTRLNGDLGPDGAMMTAVGQIDQQQFVYESLITFEQYLYPLLMRIHEERLDLFELINKLIKKNPAKAADFRNPTASANEIMTIVAEMNAQFKGLAERLNQDSVEEIDAKLGKLVKNYKKRINEYFTRV